MNRIIRCLTIALLGLLLSLGFHALPQPTVAQDAAIALVQQGKQRYEAGQFADAADALQQAARSYATMGNVSGQAQALSLASLAYQKLGQWKAAEAAIATSRSLASPTPQILNAQAHLYLASGNAQAALETWQAAERLYAQAADSAGVLGSRLNQVQAMQSLGLYRRADKQLSDVEQELLRLPDSALKVASLQSLGTFRRQAGELQLSADLLTQAAQLAKKLGLPELEGQVHLSLGNTDRVRASRARDLGATAAHEQALQAALTHYQQAATIARAPATRLQAQGNSLSLLLEVDRRRAAQALWTTLKPLLPQMPASRATVYAQVNVAITWMKAGAADAIDVPDLLNRALDQARSLNDSRATSYALGALGQWWEQTQQWTQAQTATQQALGIAQAIAAPDLIYQWQWQLGRLQQQTPTRNYDAAIAHYTQAIAVLNQLRSDLVALNPDIQFSFRDRVEPVYRQFVDLLLRSQPSQAELNQARRTIEALQLAELDNFFQDACAKPASVNIDDLDPTAAIVYPIILPDRLEVILKLPGSETLHRAYTRISEAEVNQVIDRLRVALQRRSTNPRQFRQLATPLYDWLIRPFETELDTAADRAQSSVKTLVFVLDGALRNIPPAALSDGDRYLIERYAIAVAPGLQLVNPQPFSGRLNVLIAGAANAPSFEKEGLGAIDHVSRELAGVQQQFPRSQRLENQSFLKENIQAQIRSTPFNVVHVATHGQFSSNPEQTFILDWNRRIRLREFDTLLRVPDADTRNPAAIELLILSACETATGDSHAALGLAGMAIRAGARSTIATLFQVNDASTAELMIRFYQGLTHSSLTKAEVLRETQLAFLRKFEGTDYNRPYHWAPFILIGNWL